MLNLHLSNRLFRFALSGALTLTGCEAEVWTTEVPDEATNEATVPVTDAAAADAAAADAAAADAG